MDKDISHKFYHIRQKNVNVTRYFKAIAIITIKHELSYFSHFNL